jgi:hypothetical protein
MLTLQEQNAMAYESSITTVEGNQVFVAKNSKSIFSAAPAQEKPTNPKDLIGTNKVPLNLVPTTTMAYLSIGHLEGHLKYGKVNWREAGVKFSIYLDAALRHIKKLDDGQWADPETKVPHLANALACLSIIVDAYECEKLIDDRPKQGAGAETLDRLAEIVKHLRELHGDKNPKHYTHEGPIDDSKG